MNQLEQMDMYAQAFQEAQRIKLEDDIRALEHYLGYGYFQHPTTRDAMRNLLNSLKEELGAI